MNRTYSWRASPCLVEVESPHDRVGTAGPTDTLVPEPEAKKFQILGRYTPGNKECRRSSEPS